MIVDVAPEVKWVPENGYKNLRVTVEIDSDIDAQKVYEKELRHRHKSLGALRIVTDRGLQVTNAQTTYIRICSLFFIFICFEFYLCLSLFCMFM